MNYIWCGMIIISIIVSVFNGTVSETINGAFEGAKSAVFTLLSFAGVMCFWTGIMKIAEKAGLSQKVERLLKPVISFLFPKAGSEAKKYISMNMSANLLGMGNAATPMGIKAMECLDKENDRPLHASDNMCMLVVLNTTSLQLIPTTIIALRTAANSSEPFSIILPIWISSLTAVITAVFLAKLSFRRKKI
ncbi:MAG: spore maturation protein A [Clostridia bacterium]|nr:spore maturation protein A [Clostridia bacterium]